MTPLIMGITQTQIQPKLMDKLISSQHSKPIVIELWQSNQSIIQIAHYLRTIKSLLISLSILKGKSNKKETKK